MPPWSVSSKLSAGHRAACRTTGKGQFAAGLPWREIAAIGNILRNDDERVDITILWRVATEQLDELEAVVDKMMVAHRLPPPPVAGSAWQEALTGLRGRLTPNAALAQATWFRVGGAAELLFQPADADDLAAALAQLPAEVPVTVLGVGSNLLVRDGGVRGLVIRLSAGGFGGLAVEEGGQIRAGAAVLDKRLAAFALEAGIGGFAFFHGIPGTVGGALRMNAGANGVETADRLVEAVAVDRGGNHHRIRRERMGFSYRHSAAPEDLIFTEAVFQGLAADRPAIEAEMAAVQQHRETVQPIRAKTGGSTFTNPPGKRAWELIDAAGCRGLTIGGAQVSPMHCNFLINTGAATARDLELLGETVRARVLAQSGVRLHWEIRRVGDFAAGDVEPFLGAAGAGV